MNFNEYKEKALKDPATKAVYDEMTRVEKILEPLLSDIRKGKFGTKNRAELLTRLEDIMV